MRSSHLPKALASLRQQYDTVILDLPAILVSSDSLALTDLVDGVLFVVRSGVTPSALAREALMQLDDSRGRLRGVVLNGHQTTLPRWLQRWCGA
jgi:Mrp family chromosome partitioning ATPase